MPDHLVDPTCNTPAPGAHMHNSCDCPRLTIEVAAYDHLERVTAQRDALLEAVRMVADGECSSLDPKSGCDPTSTAGLCEVCTCRHALTAAQALGELEHLVGDR